VRFLRLALLVSVVLPTPSLAEKKRDEIIVVTARRLDERLPDIPLAINAFGAQDLGAGAIDSLQSLAAQVPGLSFEAIWGGANSFPILRGQNQPSVAGDSVGMFVDGVYQGNRDAIDVEPLDLERIEVIHGPQSALFGRSSFAGLIHYVPAQPTEQLFASGSADVGSDNLYGLRAAVSGPLDARFKARLAVSWNQADSTYFNTALPSQSLGSSHRFALAASLATRDSSGPLSLRLSGRFGDIRSGQPAFFTLDSGEFNCGGRDATSGAWSYYCGEAPVVSWVSISPDIPDSRTRTGQVALYISLDLGAAKLRAISSLYRADSDAYRDFDGSPDGDIYGVCLQGVNCTGIGSLSIPVIRLQQVNIVQRRSLSSREITQEFRLLGPPSKRFTWQLGANVSWSRLHTVFAYGGARGVLGAAERLSSLVPGNPQRVGAPAAINNGLTGDPGAVQAAQNDFANLRRIAAVFATVDFRLDERLRLRGEVRWNHERVEVDSRRSNFQLSFGKALGPRSFGDITPRFSLDWRPTDGWLVYASYARGSRSGGINATPGLVSEEQTFAPETNWTSEIGARYSSSGLVRSAQVTAYDIDWRNTQILGLSITPGVTALVTRNTAGIRTRGIEASARLMPARWLELDLVGSYTNPRFKPGSEDPGSGAFCGLSSASLTSSFCAIRLSTISPGQLVPDISGKLVLRAAKVSWASGITLAPQNGALNGIRLRLGVNYLDDVYERAVNGLYYGRRTLADARLTLPLGRFSLDVWGTNLADTRYVRAAAGRQPQFYTGVPRPTDLILGEGRRVGLTLRFET
jgi:iron complex outermembrane recepter protein